MSREAPDPAWIATRCRGAARALRRAVSATDLIHTRPGFGWTVRPARGSILASTRSAHWDPEPDYFSHWVRDAAIALSAVPMAVAVDPASAAFWHAAIADHVRFSLAISDPARRGPLTNPLSATTRPDCRRFLRPDADLAALAGEAWLGEPRVAADGGPDLEHWSRPQHDGPALRARVLIDLFDGMPKDLRPEAETLIARDLGFVARVAGQPCIGPWEEAPPRHDGFTLIVQWDALDRGAAWAAARGRSAAPLLAAADRLLEMAGRLADPRSGGWRASLEAGPGSLDGATVLAILHADRRAGPFALTAPRTAATVAALERSFADLYPINRGRGHPAIGRWAEDSYFGGNPWYPLTLGFAELHYRIAAGTGDGAAFAKAEGWMALVAEVAPEGDDLPEQFDRETGAPRSCLALTWSAAAFLRAAAAREAALQAIGSGPARSR